MEAQGSCGRLAKCNPHVWSAYCAISLMTRIHELPPTRGFCRHSESAWVGNPTNAPAFIFSTARSQARHIPVFVS